MITDILWLIRIRASAYLNRHKIARKKERIIAHLNGRAFHDVVKIDHDTGTVIILP